MDNQEIVQELTLIAVQKTDAVLPDDIVKRYFSLLPRVNAAYEKYSSKVSDRWTNQDTIDL